MARYGLNWIRTSMQIWISMTVDGPSASRILKNRSLKRKQVTGVREGVWSLRVDTIDTTRNNYNFNYDCRMNHTEESRNSIRLRDYYMARNTLTWLTWLTCHTSHFLYRINPHFETLLYISLDDMSPTPPNFGTIPGMVELSLSPSLLNDWLN